MKSRSAIFPPARRAGGARAPRIARSAELASGEGPAALTGAPSCGLAAAEASCRAKMSANCSLARDSESDREIKLLVVPPPATCSSAATVPFCCSSSIITSHEEALVGSGGASSSVPACCASTSTKPPLSSARTKRLSIFSVVAALLAPSGPLVDVFIAIFLIDIDVAFDVCGRRFLFPFAAICDSCCTFSFSASCVCRRE
mmetsp:Transcript_16422/g.40585  ORF Transcript_16422/g.40585 Transcript_16422/m.40585 type:complete len:201 (+) Transcript_16422:1229-1831(+)